MSPLPTASTTLRKGALVVLRGALLCVSAAGAVSAHDHGHFGELSIEELMNESVTSVSKREQRLADVASAVSVLTNDDLRRSGATTLPDALRLVPGLNVASVNASEWAVSARGFNNLYANKLLVQIDGRAVYSPLFAGTYWDLQQPMLEDVERIEVIRGPGATIWGANAVNGVISVVGRDARDTQGTLVYGGAGDVQRARAGARHGGRLGEDRHYRVFGSYQQTDDFATAAGDGWHSWHGGFRYDDHSRADTQLTWQADTTGADRGTGEAYNLNTLGRWTRRFGEGSQIELQAYYDRISRDERTTARATNDTFDLSLEHSFRPGARTGLIWGMGYRHVDSRIGETTPAIRLVDDGFSAQLLSAFVQSEYEAVPERLFVTTGIKAEHNSYTGLELQPGLRAVLKTAPRQSLWAAVSRAVRTPSALEGRDLFAVAFDAPFTGPDGGLYTPTVFGNRQLEAEVLWAYELGYRVELGRRLGFDAAAFFNDYRHLIVVDPLARLVHGEPVGIAAFRFANDAYGHVYGGELVATYLAHDNWTLTGSYALLLGHDHGSGGFDQRGSPQQQASLRSAHRLGSRLELDAQLRYVDAISGAPAYLAADLRLGYRPAGQLELSLTGRNLLDDRHPEQGMAPFARATEVPRSIHGGISWRF